jgi:hypothetical protein
MLTVVYFYTMGDQQPPAPPPPQGPPPNQWGFEQNRAVAERQHDQIIEIGNRLDEATINAGNLALRMVLLISKSKRMDDVPQKCTSMAA